MEPEGLEVLNGSNLPIKFGVHMNILTFLSKYLNFKDSFYHFLRFTGDFFFSFNRTVGPILLSVKPPATGDIQEAFMI